MPRKEEQLITFAKLKPSFWKIRLWKNIGFSPDREVRWMHHYLLAPGHSNIIVKLIIEVEFPNLFGRKYTGRLGSSNRLSFS